MGKFSIESASSPVEWVVPDYSASTPQAQRIFLYFSPENGELWVEQWPQAEQGVPAYVWYRRQVRWLLPPMIDAVRLTEAINSGACDDDFQAIMDGYSTELDPNTHRFYGAYTTEAEAAIERIRQRIEQAPLVDSDVAGIMEAGDWFEYAKPDVAPDATDEELSALADQFEREALAENVVLYGTYRYLTELREAAREAVG